MQILEADTANTQRYKSDANESGALLYYEQIEALNSSVQPLKQTETWLILNTKV